MRSLLVGLILLLVSGPVLAVPSARLSWDDCDVLTVDKSWSGPGAYTLVISASGISGRNVSFFAGMAFYPHSVVPAWDFSKYDYWGGSSCHPYTELAFLSAAGSCPDYPKTLFDCHMWKNSLTSPGPTGMWLQLLLDPDFVADPAQRYTLLRMVFDHSASVAGVVPGACDRADEPMCFRLTSPRLTDASYASSIMAEDRFYVTWQDPSNSLDCPASTPARPKTWGGIKAQYR